MRYVCVTCGAPRDDGDYCAVAPVGRQDCRWDRREPVPAVRRHQVRTLVLVALLMATAVSTISAMRLNPMAVSTMVEDRRAGLVRHAAVPFSASAHVSGVPIDAFSWEQQRYVGAVPILAYTVPRVGKKWPDPLTE
jgi:hypothetical protein